MDEELSHIMGISGTPRYNIKAVVRQAQINISTLRAWEQRYGVPQPTRSDSGHRLYSARDVAVIRWLKQCTDRGLNISQAVAMLRAFEPEHPANEGYDRAGLPDGVGLAKIRGQLLDALNAVQIHRAHLLVNTACALYPLDSVILDLLHPVQIALGERWASGTICVAEERVGSNFIRQRLLGLMQVHEPFARGPRLVCACAPEEQHEMGLLMFSLLMELRGWEVIYLGQSVSTEGLAPFLKTLAPGVVYLSCTMAEHIQGMLDMARVVRTLEGSRLTLAYGGRLFTQHPELRHNMPGAFLGDDLREAVTRAEELISHQSLSNVPATATRWRA